MFHGGPGGLIVIAVVVIGRVVLQRYDLLALLRNRQGRLIVPAQPTIQALMPSLYLTSGIFVPDPNLPNWLRLHAVAKRYRRQRAAGCCVTWIWTLLPGSTI